MRPVGLLAIGDSLHRLLPVVAALPPSWNGAALLLRRFYRHPAAAAMGTDRLARSTLLEMVCCLALNVARRLVSPSPGLALPRYGRAALAELRGSFLAVGFDRLRSRILAHWARLRFPLGFAALVLGSGHRSLNGGATGKRFGYVGSWVNFKPLVRFMTLRLRMTSCHRGWQSPNILFGVSATPSIFGLLMQILAGYAARPGSPLAHWLASPRRSAFGLEVARSWYPTEAAAAIVALPTHVLRTRPCSPLAHWLALPRRSAFGLEVALTCLPGTGSAVILTLEGKRKRTVR